MFGTGMDNHAKREYELLLVTLSLRLRASKIATRSRKATQMTLLLTQMSATSLLNLMLLTWKGRGGGLEVDLGWEFKLVRNLIGNCHSFVLSKAQKKPTHLRKETGLKQENGINW